MQLFDKITNDMKSAMKAKDQLRVSTLRLIMAQLKNEHIAIQQDLTSEQELAVLMNAAKKRKEAIEFYQKSSRIDLVEKEQKELAIISEYLPKQLSDEEIDQTISVIISGLGTVTLKDLGRVMAEAMKELKGKADGKKVQELVRQRLA